MTLEQRLAEALHSTDGYEPSSDLYARVERSLAEDLAHRRRLLRNTTAIVIAVAFAVLFAGTFITRGVGGSLLIPRWTLELIESLALIGIMTTIGPSIRRFGRNYVDDIFHVSPTTGKSILGLLDTAYYLVFAGFILMTMSLSISGLAIPLQAGLQEAADRFAAFFVIMGILHATTLAALPVVGLIFTSTAWRADRARLGVEAPIAGEKAQRADSIVKTIVIVALVLAVGGAITLLPGLFGLLVGADG